VTASSVEGFMLKKSSIPGGERVEWPEGLETPGGVRGCALTTQLLSLIRRGDQ